MFVGLATTNMRSVMRDFRIPTTELAFDEEFRNALALEKYGRWAKDLTKDQVLAVLWAIGEYGCRSQSILECLDRHPEEFHPSDGLPRARLGLEILAAMAEGHHFTAGEVIERVQAVLKKWRTELGIPQE
jgi:hypothetical protein